MELNSEIARLVSSLNDRGRCQGRLVRCESRCEGEQRQREASSGEADRAETAPQEKERETAETVAKCLKNVMEFESEGDMLQVLPVVNGAGAGSHRVSFGMSLDRLGAVG